jgi:hypothetical protein
MASTVSNHVKYLLATKIIDFANDTFVICLMQSGFTYDKDSDSMYSDISGSELATASGYVAKAKVLPGVVITEDDTDDRTEITWNSVSWLADGGDIGPTPGAVIVDDTVDGSPVIGYIDFSGDQTQAEGGTATITGLEFRIS